MSFKALSSSVSIFSLLIPALLFTACGSQKKQLCEQLAPAADEAVSVSIQEGKFSEEYEMLRGDFAHLGMLRAGYDRTKDHRFMDVFDFFNSLGGWTPEGAKYVRAAGQGLMRDYCGTPLPFTACVDAVSSLAFGARATTVAECKKVVSKAAADCVAWTVSTKVDDISEAEVEACSNFSYRAQADCVGAISKLTFGVRFGTITACATVKSEPSMQCVERLVSTQMRLKFNDISEDAIVSCGGK